MRTLAFIKKDGYGNSEDVYIICPLCKTISNMPDIEDYVKDNCLVWCNNCNEVLICTSPDDFQNKMYFGEDMDGCTKKLSEAEAGVFIKKHNFVFENDLSNYHIYSVGLLQITELSDKHLDGMDSNGSDDDYVGESWQGNIMRFSDAYATGCKLGHDGSFLYYKAICSECGVSYQSYIWGD